MLKLYFNDQKGNTTVVPLVKEEIRIGREDGNTVRLTEPEVSDQHARVLVSDELVTIEDLGSEGGTWVNGERIAGRTALRAGDVAAIGNFQLGVLAEGEEPPSSQKQPGEFHRDAATTIMAQAPAGKAADEEVTREHDDLDGPAHPATVQLSPPQLAKLQEVADKRGVPIDELIATVLDGYLQQREEDS
jgi:pSer/pThr/pTyr-binding forkhead associated (FHA) protein